MPDTDLAALFDDNVKQLNILHVSAAGVVKGLLMELKRPGRDTFIRLKNATPNGHTVEYDFVQGNRALIPDIADALGFESANETRLTVHRA